MEFSYTAVTKEGSKETSTVQAANLSMAGRLLKERGLLPTQIQPKTDNSLLAKMKNIATVSLDEKINFIENLGIMLKAGIAISRALQILVKQTTNPRFQNILSELHSQVEQGKTMSDAMSKYPSVFSDIVVSMIRVGEVSGNLEKSLEYLSIQLQREANLKSKTTGAMIYPSVIVSAMIIIGVLMSIFVLPSLTSVFEQSGADLPITTKMVIVFSRFMSGHAALVLGGMVVFVILFISALRTKTGQRILDWFLLHFMIINTIVKKINLARFSRILSSMLKSGIPIVQGLEVSAQSLGNVFYRELIMQVSSDVKLGKPLADSLAKKQNLFPVLVTQMIQVGEESGTVQEILEQLAEHYEEQVDDTLKNMSSIIEPLLLLIIGGVVGFLALALIAPIYNISQSIQ